MRLTLTHSDSVSMSQTCTATLKRATTSLPAPAYRFMLLTSLGIEETSGLSGVDAKCQQAAASGSNLPPGTYKTWLSDVSTAGSRTGMVRSLPAGRAASQATTVAAPTRLAAEPRRGTTPSRSARAHDY